ncbi:uncharacterized protein [Nicotiana sylvestris]|uniref:uncharacterized protein n=1 Tax=Nicotiana sylvestris TaxID=4096 RepID=UPI00388C8552
MARELEMDISYQQLVRIAWRIEGMHVREKEERETKRSRESDHFSGARAPATGRHGRVYMSRPVHSALPAASVIPAPPRPQEPYYVPPISSVPTARGAFRGQSSRHGPSQSWLLRPPRACFERGDTCHMIVPHSTKPISSIPESDDKDSLISNLAEELKKLTSQIQGVEGSKGIGGLNYEDICIQTDVELSEEYKPPKFEMFDGTWDPRVHLRTYCNKLVGVGNDERIHIKLFMRSLKGDTLSWYISQYSKKWSNWVSMATDFMDRFKFNTENVPDMFYIQNLKNKPKETFHEYATH